jgi:hypothetical protein
MLVCFDFYSETNQQTVLPTPQLLVDSRWSDLKSSAVVLLSVCSAIILPSKSKVVDCQEPKQNPKPPVLEMKADPLLNQQSGKDPKSKDATDPNDSDKIKLPGPLPAIPIPKMPNISMDDIMDKVHTLGEKIGDEIKGRVPTLADYFQAVDTIRKELQLGDGSLYQSIVANMSDSNKNPEIQLDASVR